jgi:hypothetical protein
MKLYEHVAALDQVGEWLAETDGELTPELEELLEQAGIDFDEKAQNVALKVIQLQRESDMINVEVDRLTARAKARKSAAESLKGYLKMQMERAGRPVVKGTLTTVRLANSPPKLLGGDTLDERALRELAQSSPSLVTVIPERVELNRAEVLSAWRLDGTVPDGLRVEIGQHVRVR